MTSPRIAVVGTGANGAPIGADMVRAGLDVTFIEQWPDHVEVMRRDGLTVHLPDETQVTRVNAYHLCQVAELTGSFDIVFISVKTYDTRWATELIKPMLHDESVVVGLQNGMTIDDVADIVGPERTLGAVLGIAANMFEPGVVTRQYGPSETWLAIGALPGYSPKLLPAAARALAHAGHTEVVADIRASKWMKLIGNIPEMLPSAILNVPLLTAAATPGMRPVMDAAAREAYRVARALGITMQPVLGIREDQIPDSDDYAVDLLEKILESFSRPDTRVAVLQDWDKHRRAELDAFSGYIVKQQAASGVHTPVNEAILAIAKSVENGNLKPNIANVALLVRAFDEIQQKL